jgi:toxin YoeB
MNWKNILTKAPANPSNLNIYDVPTWSRRISAKHRLVYQIEETVVTVLVLAAWGITTISNIA